MSNGSGSCPTIIEHSSTIVAFDSKMVEIQRFSLGSKREESSDHHIADALMQLSQSQEDASINHSKREFECKTCSKRFSSFQALGGHRTSHKRPRLSSDSPDLQAAVPTSKSKVHQCSICGLEFALGQALGGHMRRHRGDDDQDQGPSRSLGSGTGLQLDVALHRGSVVDTELRLGLGLEQNVRTPTLVDFFH